MQPKILTLTIAVTLFGILDTSAQQPVLTEKRSVITEFGSLKVN